MELVYGTDTDVVLHRCDATGLMAHAEWPKKSTATLAVASMSSSTDLKLCRYGVGWWLLCGVVAYVWCV
jgi:hypothetical protein